MTEKVYFSLGTNLGDREANIMRALALMDECFGVHYDVLSTIIETESWGFEGNAFLNAAVCYLLDSDPFEVLETCKKIERQMGREQYPLYDDGGNRIYHDRVIDIDILLYGDRRIDSEKLVIPHPLMEKRDFVMIPLKELIDNK